MVCSFLGARNRPQNNRNELICPGVNNYDMGSFKHFINQELFVEFATDSFDQGNVDYMQAGSPSQKPWSATKDEILDMWQKLRPDTPIYLTPMDDSDSPTVGGGEHSSYGEDGIRITGSWAFISSVLGRLKELIQYENPQSKLRLVFRGIDSNRMARPDRQSFAFYVNLERRKPPKPKAPKLPTAPGL